MVRAQLANFLSSLRANGRGRTPPPNHQPDPALQVEVEQLREQVQGLHNDVAILRQELASSGMREVAQELKDLEEGTPNLPMFE